MNTGRSHITDWQQVAAEAKAEIDKQISESEQVKVNEKIKYLSVNDILNFKKSDKFLIKDVIYPNTVNSIISPPSGFKSIISMYMAICISQGKPFFGYDTQKGTVLMIDNENNHMIIKSRYESLINGMGINKDDLDIHYLLREGKMDDEAFTQNVVKYITEHNVKLVVIDTLLRSHNLEENSSKDMNHLYDQFCKLLINDASVLFLHHTTKVGKYRGSSDILGQVDSQFEIIRPSDKGTVFRLINNKNRMGEISTIEGNVFYNKKTNITSIEGESVSDGTDDEEQDDKTSWRAAEQFVAEYAITHRKFKRSELFDEWAARDANCETKVSKSTLKRCLAWMAKKKILDNKTAHGTYIINEEEQSKLDKWSGDETL
jgi:hypothetical protein